MNPSTEQTFLSKRRRFSQVPLSLIPALVFCGCSGSGDGVSGQLLLEGQPISGELLFEPLDVESKSVGQSATVHTDETGSFECSLPDLEKVTYLRIVIRTTPVSNEGLPSAFDSQALPAKVVTLVRKLPVRRPFVFALTR